MTLTTGCPLPAEEHSIYTEDETMEQTDSASEWENVQEPLSQQELMYRQAVGATLQEASVMAALRHVQQDMTPTMGPTSQEQLALEDDREL